MALKLTLSTMLLSFLMGLVVWATQPTGKAFSWVESSEQDYLIGYLPSDYQELYVSASLRMGDYAGAIRALRSAVPGSYSVYAAIGRMGNRLVLSTGASFPIFQEQYVSEEYTAARNLRIQSGRLFNPDEGDEFVIGHALAKQVFGDPAQAVGQPVDIVGTRPLRKATIVGVLAPSPAQDPDLDTDSALVGSLTTEIAASPLVATMPLHLVVRTVATDPEGTLTAIERWMGEYFGPSGRLMRANESTDRQAKIVELAPRIEARRRTFLAFGGALAVAALVALYAQSYWYLLRERQLLGVDKALGATRYRLALRLVTSQLPWGVLGSVAGLGGLWSLYDLIPDVFLTRPPLSVMGFAIGVPMVALFTLASLIGVPLVRAPAMELIRGKVQGGRIKPLLVLVYGGLAIALAGGLAATRVEENVRAEARALNDRFGLMYSLQAGNPVLDTRTERAFEGADFVPVFTTKDTEALVRLPGIESATLAQTVPQLTVSLDERQTTVMAVAADVTYLSFMGLLLAAGDGGACVLAPQVAEDLGARLGDTLALTGLTGSVPCRLSGILEEHNPLWSWLVTDLPDVITPPLDGIGLALPGNTAIPFRSTRVLLRLAIPDAEGSVRTWLEADHPGIGAEVVPTTPDVEGLLASLGLQARLFSLMAALAVVLCVWGIVGGFLALLDAEKFKTALDRALGLSLNGVTRRWWNQMIAWSTISATAGVAGGLLTTRALYDALALDIPNLPRVERLSLGLGSVGLVVLLLAALSTALSLTGRRWVARRSALQLLKEGAA